MSEMPCFNHLEAAALPGCPRHDVDEGYCQGSQEGPGRRVESIRSWVLDPPNEAHYQKRVDNFVESQRHAHADKLCILPLICAEDTLHEGIAIFGVLCNEILYAFLQSLGLILDFHSIRYFSLLLKSYALSHSAIEKGFSVVKEYTPPNRGVFAKALSLEDSSCLLAFNIFLFHFYFRVNL